MNEKTLKQFFQDEVRYHTQHYVDAVSNQFVPVWLADEFVEQQKMFISEVSETELEEIYQAAEKWFKTWKFRKRYKNGQS